MGTFPCGSLAAPEAHVVSTEEHWNPFPMAQLGRRGEGPQQTAAPTCRVSLLRLAFGFPFLASEDRCWVQAWQVVLSGLHAAFTSGILISVHAGKLPVEFLVLLSLLVDSAYLSP